MAVSLLVSYETILVLIETIVKKASVGNVVAPISELNMPRTKVRAERPFSADPLDFERLLTFRINRLAETLERSAGRQFLDRHGLNIAEWRVLLLVNRFGTITAKEICRIATMDKVRVSRAVSNLLGRRLLEQSPDKDDRRRTILTASARGKAVFEAVWPIAQARQTDLLSLFSDDELSLFSSLMARLHARAEEILIGSTSEA